MRIYALSDPHLSLNTPNKEMDRFGPEWANHHLKIKDTWNQVVAEDDIVLIPGDISWAMRADGARADLDFLANLPGRKVISKGNHDYWWESHRKVRKILPEGMLAIGANAARIENLLVCGTRLWDIPGVSFDDIVEMPPAEKEGEDLPQRTEDDIERDRKIYQREIGRLKIALAEMEKLEKGTEDAPTKIVMLHYPPTDSKLSETELTRILEEHGIDHVVFGHLHNVYPDINPKPFGERNGIEYHFTSVDYLGFQPKLITEF
jgi:predicted phosphohydrolase